MIKELFDSTVKMQDDAEKEMKLRAAELSKIVGTDCLAIRYWGVQVSDEAWVAAHDGAEFETHGCDDYPWKVTCVVDGVEFFSIMTEEAYRNLKGAQA